MCITVGSVCDAELCSLFGFSVRIQDAMFGSMLAVLLSLKSLWMQIRRFLKSFIVKSVDLHELTRKFCFLTIFAIH